MGTQPRPRGWPSSAVTTRVRGPRSRAQGDPRRDVSGLGAQGLMGGSLRTRGQRGQEAAVTHELVLPAACLTCDVLTRSSCPQSREHPRPTQAAAGRGRGRGRDRDRAPGDAAARAGARTGPLDSGSLSRGVAAVGGTVRGAGWLPPLPTAPHLSSRPGCRWSCGRPSPPTAAWGTSASADGSGLMPPPHPQRRAPRGPAQGPRSPPAPA